jgi:hypothetical protein
VKQENEAANPKRKGDNEEKAEDSKSNKRVKTSHKPLAIAYKVTKLFVFQYGVRIGPDI